MRIHALLSLVASISVLHSSVLAEPGKAPIIDGTRVPVSQFPAVASIYVDEGICTGTLIAPRFVLTAAHCFFDESGGLINDPSVMAVGLGNKYLDVKNVSIHPTYVSRDEACIDDEVDAAIIELAGEVTGIAPIPLQRTAPKVGTNLLLVGFGTQGKGAIGEDGTFPDDGFVNYGTTILERVSGPLYVEWDFDRGESNTARGDSGGPAFADINGARYLNSITCGGTDNSEFGSSSFNTRVDTIASWIDSIAGTSPENVPPVSTSIDLKRAIVSFDDEDYLLSLSGSLNLGTTIAPRGAMVIVRVLGVEERFKLNRDAYAERKRGYDFVQLKGRLKRKVFTSPVVRFSVGLGDRRALYNAIDQHFSEEAESTPGARVELPIEVQVNDTVIQTTVSMIYKKRAGRWVKG